MQVKEGDIVKAYIRAETKDGEVFYSNLKNEPLEIKVGEQTELKGIEQVLLGMKVGEKKQKALPPKASFGEKEPQMVKTLPRGFHEADKKEGDKVFHYDSGRKESLTGTVIQAAPKVIIADFNHPISGKTVTYEAEVLDIRRPEKGQP